MLSVSRGGGIAMPDQPSDAPSPKELATRLQALVDAKPADGGHTLEWAVAAYYMGDATALAALSLRSGG
jgi:hypothetical protein